MSNTPLKTDDIKLSMSESYLRNDRLPRSDINISWTPERLAELKKCKQDLRYFAETYFFIVTLDEGKRKIDLYIPQKRILKALAKFRFVVTCASRQCGKCFAHNTSVRIRNKKTGIIEEIQIKVFFDRIKNQNNMRNAAEDFYVPGSKSV